jgi:hypothetical protein
MMRLSRITISGAMPLRDNLISNIIKEILFRKLIKKTRMIAVIPSV